MNRPAALPRVLLCLAVLSAGCGRGQPASVAAIPSDASYAPAAESPMESDGGLGGMGEPSAASASAAADRRIIYTADVRLVVDDVTALAAAVRSLAAEAGGFVGSARESGRQGGYRTASLTLRVPSSEYGVVIKALSGLGTVTDLQESAADVTAQYVDLEARIANKLREEKRLVELLDDATGKLPDVLAVEKELSRVREEVERYQGQLKVLADQVSLSTITVTAEEEVTYEPDRPRTLGERAAAAWSNSTGRLAGFFQGFVIEVVAFVPWLAVWVPLGLIVWAVWRLLRGRRGSRPRQ